MEQLELLEQEMNLIKDNIARIRAYKKQKDKEKWRPSNSNVVGELKHRMTALKQRITIASKITTADLFN